MDDLTIVGGGAAGIMAALSSRKHHPKRKVVLIEHQASLGRKLLVCGAGRCNITNVNVTPERFFGAERGFTAKVLEQFDHHAVQAFFEELGIPLYEERKGDRGKIFPVTDQAKTVLTFLLDELARCRVELRTETRATGVAKDVRGFILKTTKGDMRCARLLLASGGMTFPKLGGSLSGYELARSLGHTIVEPVPTALPLKVKNFVSKRLHGLQADAEAAVYISGKKAGADSGKIMFTKYGFTGPAILNISRPVSIRMNRERKDNCELRLNFLPGRSPAQAKKLLKERWAKRPDQLMSINLCGLLKNRIPQAFLDDLKIGDAPVSKITAKNKARITLRLCDWRLPIEGTTGFEEGEFTAGGVDSREINPATMGSRIAPGLYLAGEIVDVDGDVGGFNLTWAWSSGFVAGK